MGEVRRRTQKYCTVCQRPAKSCRDAAHPIERRPFGNIQIRYYDRSGRRREYTTKHTDRSEAERELRQKEFTKKVLPRRLPPKRRHVDWLPFSGRPQETPPTDSRDPDHVEDARLWRQYGIRLSDYVRMFNEQDGRCGGCGRPPLTDQRLVVDHDHACCPGPRSCGKCVRGLLCQGCNRAPDDPAALLGKHRYLEAYARKLAERIRDPS